MAVPSSPTRRQTGFQLPDPSHNQFNATNDSEFSTRSRNDTQDTITQSHLDHFHDQAGIISQLQVSRHSRADIEQHVIGLI